MIKPTKDIPEKSEIELVTTKKTKTLSGKSTLTYHVGRDEDANWYVRVWVNSSNGYFSNRYVSMAKIEEVLKRQGDAEFSSYALKELFPGSVNTSGFFTAVLMNEGLIKIAEGKKRKLVYTGKGLTIDSAKPKPRRTVKKAAAKTAARKPTAKSTK
jgi:hypothetical protein